MNSPAVGLRVASVFFGLVCLGHLARLLLQLEVTVAGYHVPVWFSGPAVIMTAILCVWLWRLSSPGAERTHPDTTGAHPPATPATP